MRFLLLTIALLVGGCAAKQQLALNDAYSSGQRAKSEAIKACSQSAEVAACMLGVAVAWGNGSGDNVPVVQSDLSVVLNSSVLGIVGGSAISAVRDIRVAQSQERTQIAGINANAATQQATFNAFERTAASGFNAIGNTAVRGFDAVSNTALAGLGSTERVATSAVNAGAYSSAAWADMVRNQRPTYQLGAGAFIGDGNTTLNGDGLIDQSQTGRDRDVRRTCTASAQSAVTNSQTGSTSGTTGPSTSLGFTPAPQLPVRIECGG